MLNQFGYTLAGKASISKVHEACPKKATDFTGNYSLLTEDVGSGKEIRTRIAMAKEAFNNKKELLTKSLRKDVKKKIVKAVVWSVALYGAETCTLLKEDVRRLEAFEMWI